MSTVSENTHIVQIGNLSVHYWESNAHLPNTIMMLRGFRSSEKGLLKLARQFPDHHIIIPDFPGYGRTTELPGEDNTVDSYAEVIAGLIQKLKLKDITLVGHSFGALVGLACAADHPQGISKLVLISPVPKANLTVRATTLYYLIGKALPAPLNRQWLTSRPIQDRIRNYIISTQDPEIHAEIMSEGEQELRELRPNINVQNYLSLVNSDPTAWVEAIKIPTLAITGDIDRISRVADVVNTYQSPFVTINVVEGMGHYAPAEIPGEISRKVQDWLANQTQVTA